jgi:hypothetical protein
VDTEVLQREVVHGDLAANDATIVAQEEATVHDLELSLTKEGV